MPDDLSFREAREYVVYKHKQKQWYEFRAIANEESNNPMFLPAGTVHAPTMDKAVHIYFKGHARIGNGLEIVLLNQHAATVKVVGKRKMNVKRLERKKGEAPKETKGKPKTHRRSRSGPDVE